MVDGNDSDLASLPAIAYPWSALKPSGGLTLIGDKLDTTTRIGWSDLGVHLYFKVSYETGVVIVPTGTDQLWYGDALEIFPQGRRRAHRRIRRRRRSGCAPDHRGARCDQPAPRTEMAVG